MLITDTEDTEDGCDPFPCNSNASCEDIRDGYKCNCDSGYAANGQMFEADGEVLNLNDRLHPCVSDIEYYKRNTETILENNHCIRGT